jgi:hypothetical protein
MKAFSIEVSKKTAGPRKNGQFLDKGDNNPKSIQYENQRSRCRQLMDLPIGCFSITEYVEAKIFLDQFKFDNGETAETVNVSIALLERVVRELSAVSSKPLYRSDDKERSKHHFLLKARDWILNPWYVNVMVLSNWKTAFTKGLDVISPVGLWNKLDTMANKWLPGDFRYDVATVTMILEAMLHHKSPADAPAVAEDVLYRISTNRDSSSHLAVQPNAVFYNVVLSCWAKSGLREASTRMDAILDLMRKEQQIDSTAMTAPNAITYNILLRYWGGKPVVAKMETVYQMMIEKDKISPNLRNLLPVVYGYCKARLLDRARNAIHEMIFIQKQRTRFQEFDDKNEDENHGNRLIGNAAHEIMLACRSIIMSTANLKKKGTAIALSEEIWGWMEKQPGILVAGVDGNIKSGIKLATTLMDIHARCGNVHRASEIATRIDELSDTSSSGKWSTTTSTAIQFSIRLKAMGESGRLKQATKLWEATLADPMESRKKINIHVFNELINMWSESTDDADAVEKVFSLFQNLKDSPNAQSIGLQPDRYTYTALLKCLLSLTRGHPSRAVSKAMILLNEMESRHASAGGGGTVADDLKADVFAYTLAIQIALQSGDFGHYKLLVERMKAAGAPPNTRTYNAVLRFWSMKGGIAAAIRAQDILEYMRRHSETEDAYDEEKRTATFVTGRKKPPLVRPNAFSYNLTMVAWTNSGAPDAAERLWKLYEKQRADRVGVNLTILHTLIPFLASQKDRTAVDRADSLLQYMETSGRGDLVPDDRHYDPVLRGYLRLDSPGMAWKVLERRIYGYLYNGKGVEEDKKKSIASPKCIRSETMHAIVESFIKIGDLSGASKFVDKMTSLKEKSYLRDGPSIETCKLLEEAWKASEWVERNDRMHDLKVVMDRLTVEEEEPPRVLPTPYDW